jgi:two-component system, NarL family, sensor histidine kinase DesK
MSAPGAALPRRRLTAGLLVEHYAHPTRRRVGMHDGETVDGPTVRLATAGVVVYSVAAPLVSLGRYLQDDQVSPWVVVLVLGVVPVLAWLTRAAARASFTRAQLAVLAVALAVTAVAAAALGPPGWAQLYVPVALVAVVMPPVWSVVFLVGLAALTGPLAAAAGRPDFALFYVAGVLVGVSPLVVSIRLVRSVRQLHAARQELAAQAIARERVRIDEDLTTVVGRALGDLAERADRAAALLGTDPTTAGDQLRALAADARRTLADTRRVVRGYRDVPLPAELETAAALLAAAGVPARIQGPSGEPVDPAHRVALRQEVARLLATSGATEAVVLAVRDGRPSVLPRNPR